MYQTHESQRLTLTVAEAARRLGIGRNTAYEAVRLGYIPTIRVGRRVLVPRAALDRLLDGTAVASPVDPAAPTTHRRQHA